MTLFTTAKQWVDQGNPVIPVFYQSKRPMIRWESYQSILPDENLLKQWFPTDLRNIGLVTGNGLVVIDFDVMEVFEYWNKLFPLNTFMVKTRRGVHVYVITAQPAKNYHSELLDVKAERGYVLVPPSIHPSGYQYQIHQNSPILKIEKLTDVLPEEFTPKANAVSTEPIAILSNDPWEIADTAIDIPENAVQKIREKTSVLSLLPGAQKSSSDGRWYVTLCPFHNDHTPSFWIDTKRQLCGCRKCNIKDMDVINLYARLNNISNREAIYKLVNC